MQILKGLTFILIAASLLLGCRSQTASPALVKPACETLSKETVASVQGELVVDATESKRSTGDLAASQCFYRLPTFNKSVSLEMTSGPDASIDDFWNKRFRDRGPSEEEEEERERERKAGEQADSEEKPPSGPQPVSGMGDEAFWTASQIGGSLFVRRGAAVYRIGIGGPEDSNTRLERAKALANSFLTK